MINNLEYVEYVVLDENKEIERFGHCQRAVLESQAIGNQTVVEVPSGTLKLVYAVDEYPLNLAPLKKQKREEIKTARDNSILEGIDIDGVGVFDADPISQSKLSNAALAGLLAEREEVPFSANWILKDNSVAQLNLEQLTTVILTGSQFINQIYTDAYTLQTQLNACETIKDILDLDI